MLAFSIVFIGIIAASYILLGLVILICPVVRMWMLVNILTTVIVVTTEGAEMPKTITWDIRQLVISHSNDCVYEYCCQLYPAPQWFFEVTEVGKLIHPS